MNNTIIKIEHNTKRIFDFDIITNLSFEITQMKNYIRKSKENYYSHIEMYIDACQFR